MEDFCPSCLKKGIKNEIKLFQINLEEGVWLCKDEECVWPFRYKDFVFCPRQVGKVWSCYWDDYKPSNYKEKVITSSPSKSALCHTSAISTQNTKMIETTSSSDTYCLKNINNINSSSNVTDLKSFDNLYTSDFEESSVIPNIDIEKDSGENILNKEITAIDTNVHKSILQPINKESDDIFTGNNEDINNVRRTPKIIGIENTNIDISNIKLASQTSNVKKEISVDQKSAGITETKLKSEIEKLELSEDNENIVKPNLNTTTVEIDGLPPITLSFEVPACTTTPKTVIAPNTLTSYENNDIRNIPNNLKVKNTFAKRNITSGKQYEKFNFGAIKKNVESNNFNNSDIQNNSSNMTQVQTIEDDLPEVISNVSPTYVSNQLDKSSSSKVMIQIQKAKNDSQGIISDVNISVSNQFNKSETPLSSQKHITSNIAALNTSTNIDSVLDSLTKNYKASAQEDEWIISLLK